MTDWVHSVVVIVPAELREVGNKLACAIGHDVVPGNTFVVPVGVDEVTGYGCRTNAMQKFLNDVEAAREGVLPEGAAIEDFDLTPEDVAALFAKDEDGKPVMIFDVRPASDMIGHFDDVLAANGLQRHAEVPE